MKEILKDKILLSCAMTALFSATILSGKYIRQFLLKEEAPVKRDVKDLVPFITQSNNLMRSMAAHQKPKFEVKKTRPKHGGNEWFVGSGSEADSPSLETVIANMQDGDIISLDAGTYEFPFSRIEASNIEFRGQSGRTTLQFNYNFRTPKSKSVKLIDVDVDFSHIESDYVSFNSNTKLILENVKIVDTKLTLNFREDFLIEAHDSQFTGTNLSFTDSSKGVFTNCFFEKAQTFISLNDFAQVDIKNSQLYHFSNIGFTSDSSKAVLRAEQITLSGGKYAFYGKFDGSTIKNSTFSNLREFTLNSKVDCILCEKYNIER